MAVLYICYDGILDDLGQTQVSTSYIYSLNDKGYKFIILASKDTIGLSEEFLNQQEILSKREFLVPFNPFQKV